MNSIKPGVRLYGTRPEMCIVYTIACSIFNAHKFECVVTSGVGKKHSQFSLHYPGYAFDFRTKNIPQEAKYSILSSLKQSLPMCDIILEHEGKAQEHIHCEFDPKDDPQFQGAKMIYKSTGHWPS